MFARKVLPFLVLTSLFVMTGCFEKHPAVTTDESTTQVPLPQEESSDQFSDLLLDIARNYEGFSYLLEPDFKPAGFICDFSPSRFVAGNSQSGAFTRDLDIGLVKTMPVKREVKFSKSDHSPTHGRKLYLVFSRYQLTTGSMAAKKPYPVGQAVVKESWVPEVVSDAKENWIPVSRTLRGKPTPDAVTVERKVEIVSCARSDGRVYRAARKYGLFIMAKMDPKTPGTDGGWIYGTVSADAQKVLSVGKLESCIKCHQDAPRDRVFGL